MCHMRHQVIQEMDFFMKYGKEKRIEIAEVN